MHTVADVFCVGCNERLGWYYHKAADHMQRYKEGEWLYRIVSIEVALINLCLWGNVGKYLLEREKLAKENAWVLDE